MLLRPSRTRPVRSAFTLMEMLIVVAIIVALASVSGYFLFSQSDEGNRVQAIQEMNQIKTAAVVYKMRGPTKHLPNSVEEIIGWNQTKMPVMSPWNTPYQIKPASNPKEPPVIYCVNSSGETVAVGVE